jgi:hypothetical protein
MNLATHLHPRQGAELEQRIGNYARKTKPNETKRSVHERCNPRFKATHARGTGAASPTRARDAANRSRAPSSCVNAHAVSASTDMSRARVCRGPSTYSTPPYTDHDLRKFTQARPRRTLYAQYEHYGYVLCQINHRARDSSVPYMGMHRSQYTKMRSRAHPYHRAAGSRDRHNTTRTHTRRWRRLRRYVRARATAIARSNAARFDARRRRAVARSRAAMRRDGWRWMDDRTADGWN